MKQVVEFHLEDAGSFTLYSQYNMAGDVLATQGTRFLIQYKDVVLPV